MRLALLGRGRVVHAAALALRVVYRHVVAVDADHRRSEALAHPRDHLGVGVGVRVKG